MLPLIGAAVSAGLGMLAQRKQNKANEAAQQQQYEQQKEFAQSGIQWKVKDAKKAGIHPLYALGANTVSYSPQSVGGPDYSALANAGQNIGRAIEATRSNPAKAEALALISAQVQLEGLKLDNDLKRTQIASAMATARQAGSAPGLPSTTTVPALVGMPGQGDAPQIDGPGIELTKKISPTSPGSPNAEYGAAPEIAYYKTPGGYSVQVPQSLSESFEQDWPSFYQWYYRNKIAPMWGQNFTPPNTPLPPGTEWDYSGAAGEYYSRPKKKVWRYKGQPIW